ncbi:hypothetical protein DUI87_18493 [Hirundo rustica rustica]|uniref:Uncharacterized protein n=1 Tax=Hirundo rustica rustica TaxID=333673 RepID=A0A3M0JWE9_HIRRU|nr:hypothetical protein DUI87_18493 [Hirundo rustica rustica]
MDEAHRAVIRKVRPGQSFSQLIWYINASLKVSAEAPRKEMKTLSVLFPYDCHQKGMGEDKIKLLCNYKENS